MNKSDIYKTVTDKLIANLEVAGSWSRMWNSSMPVSLENREYKGINRMMLQCGGYSSNIYGTFNQIKAHGGVVKNGEKGHFVLFWKISKSTDTETGKEKSWLMERYYYVFNTDQCEWDEKGQAHLNKMLQRRDNKKQQNAEQILAGIPYDIDVIHAANIKSPYYSPTWDHIKIYPMEQFHSSNQYYSVLFHEYVHSTGHHSRLARLEAGTHFGDHAYSKEELVAEFGAAFLCELSGIEDNIEQSAAYIRSWSHALKSNPDWIVSAVSKARKAVEYLVPAMVEVEQESDLVAA